MLTEPGIEYNVWKAAYNETTTPLVTTAVPVYNGSNYLRQAIESLLAQTYPRHEIIVVNDGSDDGGKTEEIALSYGSAVRYFSKENGGVASALNLALREAKGEYFNWVAHDDVFLPEKIAKGVALLSSRPRGRHVVYSHYARINAQGEWISDGYYFPQSDSPLGAAYNLLLRQTLHACTIIAPHTLFLECGMFREDLPSTQDYALLFQMALKARFIELPDILVHVRVHAAQGINSIEHDIEKKHFCIDHIRMLTSEYMYKCFSPKKSVEAFLALAASMRHHNFSECNSLVSLCVGQMYQCEARRLSPEALHHAVRKSFSVYSTGLAAFKNQAYSMLPVPVRAVLRKIKNIAIAKNLIQAGSPTKKAKSSFLRGWSPKKMTAACIPARLDFNAVYAKNPLQAKDTASGEGIDMERTKRIREALPALFSDLGIRKLVDVPCGDWHWMRHVDLSGLSYIGGDAAEAVIEGNNMMFATRNVRFECLNPVTGPLPGADLILCRDFLVYLNLADALAALRQCKLSGATWLLTTTFTARDANEELYEGGPIWRPLNLEAPPFNLPSAHDYIDEGCTAGDNIYADKFLGLWKLETLTIPDSI